MGSRVLNYSVIFLLIVFVGFIVFISFWYKPLPKKIIIQGINQTRPIPKNVSYRPTKIITNCTQDSDCIWMSTNCCPASAGAYWECLNEKSYIDCKSKLVLCPQVPSPKPTLACRCIGGRCSGA